MVKNYTIEISDRKIHLETGRIAKQANGSVVVTSGETVVLVTAVATDDVREGIDFLPLTVEYQEMSYAGGQIPGNFFRRDMGRPGEKETLISRLIDRPLRPLFPDNYHYETQVIATVLSTDKENEADMLAMLGASAALEISDIPFLGPIAGVKVGRIDGEFVANPTITQQEESDINLIVAGNRDGVVMVEGGSKFVSESDMIDAIFFGHQSIQPLLEMQESLKKEVGKPKRVLADEVSDSSIQERVNQLGEPLLNDVLSIADKMERQAKRRDAQNQVVEALAEEYEDQKSEIKDAFHSLEKKMVRHMILNDAKTD
jgi:polyribonucleotide nucleotidyltransferase